MTRNETLGICHPAAFPFREDEANSMTASGPEKLPTLICLFRFGLRTMLVVVTVRDCTILRGSSNLLTTRYLGNGSYIDLATGQFTSI